MKTPIFNGIEKLKGYIEQAEKHLDTLKVATEMPVDQRMRNQKVTSEKLDVYRSILNDFEFLALHQDVMLETLRTVHSEAMAKNGAIGFKTAINLGKLKDTLEEQYLEYQKEE